MNYGLTLRASILYYRFNAFGSIKINDTGTSYSIKYFFFGDAKNRLADVRTREGETRNPDPIFDNNDELLWFFKAVFK